MLALTFDDDHDGRPVAAIGALAEAVSADAGRRMPVNVDGAIAACLSKLDLDPSYGDLLFAIARSGGLAAHIMEERERQQPMRMIDPTEVRYDGPEAHLESSESAE